jgi:hypothetical protein
LFSRIFLVFVVVPFGIDTLYLPSPNFFAWTADVGKVGVDLPDPPPPAKKKENGPQIINLRAEIIFQNLKKKKLL